MKSKFKQGSGCDDLTQPAEDAKEGESTTAEMQEEDLDETTEKADDKTPNFDSAILLQRSVAQNKSI